MSKLNNQAPTSVPTATPAPPVKVKPWPKGATILELHSTPGWPQDEAARLGWCLRRDGAILQQGETQDLQELAALAKGVRVVFWSPATETLLTEITLPTRNRSKILQALPFSLEDQILGNPEEQHYIYQSLGGGRLAVAVTRHERLRAWLQTLLTAGIQPVSFCPASLSLPYTQDAWSLLFSANEVWVRSGNYSGFACYATAQTPDAVIKVALEEARKQGLAPQNLMIFNPPADFDHASWQQALNLNLVLDQQGVCETQSGLPPVLNLLQAEYTPQVQHDDKFRQLRPAAILLGLWLISSISADIWQWRELNSAHKTATQEMTRIFRSSFPRTKVILDPAKQMQRELDALHARSGRFGSNDFLSLLSRSASALATQPQLKLENIKYGDSGLTLGLSLPDYKALEALQNRLTGPDISVKVLNATSSSSGVLARLLLSAGESSGNP